MCVLSLFRLPGEAVARGGYVRLCGANKVDSKVFSRAILARVHTVSHLFFLKQKTIRTPSGLRCGLLLSNMIYMAT